MKTFQNITRRIGFCAVLACTGLQTPLQAKITLPAFFTDNMIIQQQTTMTLFGKAKPNKKVSIETSWNNQHYETKADAQGNWQVAVSTPTAGGPYRITLSDGKKTVLENVMAGEVWFCSGQSNMAFQVSSAVDSQRKAFLEFAARKPQIRLFDMKPRWLTNAVEWDISTLDSLNRLQYYRDTEWKECNEETTNRFSAVAFAFGQMLSDSLQVPVGLILNAIGGSPAEAWIDRKTLEFEFPDILYDWKQNNFIQDWARERAALNIRKSTNKQQRHPYEPCYLYESGIQPLEKFPIRGIIWYQGESNAHNMEAHEKLFHLLTKNWRENWAEELPFYYVQLSSIDRPSWPWFRDSQRRMLQSIPNSGMAVSSAHGGSLDVHPRHKR